MEGSNDGIPPIGSKKFLEYMALKKMIEANVQEKIITCQTTTSDQCSSLSKKYDFLIGNINESLKKKISELDKEIQSVKRSTEELRVEQDSLESRLKEYLELQLNSEANLIVKLICAKIDERFDAFDKRFDSIEEKLEPIISQLKAAK